MFTQSLYQLSGSFSRSGSSKDQKSSTTVTAQKSCLSPVQFKSNISRADNLNCSGKAFQTLIGSGLPLFSWNQETPVFFFSLELLINISYTLFRDLSYTSTLCLSFKTSVAIQIWIGKSQSSPESWFSYFTFLCYIDKVITSGFDFLSAYSPKYLIFKHKQVDIFLDYYSLQGGNEHTIYLSYLLASLWLIRMNFYIC